MSFKSLFIKEDNTTPEKPVETTAQKLESFQKTAPTSIASQFNTQIQTAPSAEIAEFLDFLNEVYQKGNFPGPDYQEFTDALKEVEGAPMDEKTKFTTIFVGFKVQGVTKKRLVETGEKYVQLIGTQVTDFTKEIDGMLSGEIAQKQKDVAKITQENLDIENQMQQLANRKNANSEKINAMTTEINAQVGTLNAKKSSFEIAARDFSAKIQTNIDKIKQYLPETVTK